MPCLFAMVAGMFPRIGTLLLWLARPNLFSAAFNGSWLWPILGVVFLPFTTLMYVILWTPVIGLTTWDWFWIVMAVLIDASHWAHTGYTNRKAIPGYTETPAAAPVAAAPAVAAAPIVAAPAVAAAPLVADVETDTAAPTESETGTGTGA